MARYEHIPSSPVLLSLICAQLVLAVTELGLLSWLQWVISNGDLGSFISFGVLPGAVGIGLFVACHSIIFAVYFLITTRSIYHAYSRVAALILVVLGCIFWLITWAMFVNVLTLYGTSIPEAHYSSTGVYEAVSYEVLGHKISEGILGAILALALIEWLLFLASTVLLLRFRFPLSQRVVASDASMAQKRTSATDV
ncbi:hypothetical protein AMS68_004065 [Peltaster fructicola]|uniref:MARVEL domain-containing protein n=1 Tax=Peltaster fructicola TaxID=286661 RepID=A0A6H0XVB0_9PEZI|nr:hypothetical protein AMS68_004065 [Peltaster fructicola]